MVTINDTLYTSNLRTNSTNFTSTATSSNTAENKIIPDVLFMNYLTTANMLNNTSDPEMDYLDMPLLMADDDGVSDDETFSHKSTEHFEVQKVNQESYSELDADSESEKEPESIVRETSKSVLASTTEVSVAGAQDSLADSNTGDIDSESLTPEQEKAERNQLMSIVVKYVATKITNSFPPESMRRRRMVNEIPLDKFLLLLTSRLQLSLPQFMTGIIYLFRYMDIVYLLRYLNQSNNFANYNDMGFSIKKLIVGCFKIALTRCRVQKDWSSVTGLSNNEINQVVRVIVKRMNGKLLVKNIELVKLKLEIFRFIKMVSKIV